MTTILTTLFSLVLLTAGIVPLWIFGAGILTFVIIAQVDKACGWLQHGQRLTVWQLPKLKIALAVQVG